MHRFLRILSVSLYALIAALLCGAVGVIGGRIVSDIVNPRPNPHLNERVGYVAGGALFGALIGAIGAVVIAVRRSRHTLSVPPENPQ